MISIIYILIKEYKNKESALFLSQAKLFAISIMNKFTDNFLLII